MLINDLSKMEEIVESSQNLGWNGWDVVKYTPSYSAMFTKDAVYRNGSWYKTKTFPITEKGWNIPNSIGKSYAQVER